MPKDFNWNSAYGFICTQGQELADGKDVIQAEKLS